MLTWKILLIAIIFTILVWSLASFFFYRKTMGSLLLFINRYEALENAENESLTTSMKASFFLQKGELEKDYPLLYRHMNLYRQDQKLYRRDILVASFRTGFIHFFF